MLKVFAPLLTLSIHLTKVFNSHFLLGPVSLLGLVGHFHSKHNVLFTLIIILRGLYTSKSELNLRGMSRATFFRAQRQRCSNGGAQAMQLTLDGVAVCMPLNEMT